MTLMLFRCTSNFCNEQKKQKILKKIIKFQNFNEKIVKLRKCYLFSIVHNKDEMQYNCNHYNDNLNISSH